MRALGLGLLAWAWSVSATAGEAVGVKLPGGVVPTHYTLDLTILPEKETFDGRVVIEVKIEKPSRVIEFHGQDMTVSKLTVTDAQGPMEAVWNAIADGDGRVRLGLPREVAVGPAKIDVTYTAPFNRALSGLYRTDEAGESYAFSQMEPLDARRAFPSFDEPGFKTPYDITLTVHANHAAITNTPEVKTEPLADGLKKIRYATSKPLPTYLIAFAVGPLDVVEWQPISKSAIRDREIPLRGITAKGKGQQMRYALANTEGILLELEKYFGTPYPYEKLDLIAAIDFSAGAMENAGAIVYREQLMLLDENAALAQRRRYAAVHAHEMAHQWFGNLVTPVWWDDIWLNEAFATWMEWKAIDAWDPKGEYGRGMQAEALGAMRSDSWKSARRIAEPIRTTDDIDNAFDGITYSKGGGVISMFETYYGVDGFRKGVQLHLQRFAWGNATSKDFMQSIADANNDTEGVESFLTFLNQAGVPVAQSELKCGSGGATLEIRQGRYVPAGADARNDQVWKIPMCVAYGDASGRRQTCGMVSQRRQTIKLEGACPAWVMPNAGGAGYYRFTLPQRGWDALIANAAALNESEVLAAHDSLDAALSANSIDVDEYLARVKPLLYRDGQLPAWDVASSPSGRLIWIKDTLATDADRPAMQKLILELYGPMFEKLGLDATSELDRTNAVQATLMRVPVASIVAMEGRSPEVRAELAKRASAYLGLGGDGQLHPDAIDPSLSSMGLAVAVQDIGAPAVDAILGHLKTERNATVRDRMLSALTFSTDPAIAARVRELALSPDIRVNEMPILVYGSLRQKANAPAAWEWFKTNFDAIRDRMPPGSRGGLVGVGGGFCSGDERREFVSFFRSKVDELQGAPRQYNQMLERIDACRAVVDKQRERLPRAMPGS